MGIKYFYYLLLQNMVLNVILFVPDTLVNERFTGTMMSIMLAIPEIGLALIFIQTRALSQFPDKNVPEILMMSLPTWVARAYILSFASFWFMAGTLLSYSLISQRYALPDTPPWLLTGLFALLVVYVARMRMDTVLRGLEFLFVINVPFVAVLVLKSFLSDEFNWWAVQDIATHLLHPPSLKTLSAATFVFSGYGNMVIFHPLIRGTLKGWKHYALIGFFALTTLTTTLLIPIGYHGTDAVTHYVFKWVAPADSMSLEYFVVERVLYIFLLLYLTIALISAVLFWHVGSRTFASMFSSKRAPDIILIAFVAGTFIMARLLNTQFHMARFAETWLIIRLFAEAALVVTLAYAVRRARKST